MDPRAINKMIELYKARADKIRAEYRQKQAELAEQADETCNPAKKDETSQVETAQTQDAHEVRQDV